MRTALHIGLAVLVLIAGIAVVWAVVAHAPVPEVRPEQGAVALVRGETVQTEQVQIRVQTHGTVTPRTEIQLVPEVGGRVIWVSPALWAGGFFDEGEELVKIDPRDFELQVTRARADVARAKVALALETAEADASRREWEKLNPGNPATSLVLREPQLGQAQAEVASAEANLEKAVRDHARTVLSAPFAGRVRNKRVDAGQFVTAGSPIAELYAVDYAEVRLPLPDEELAFLDLPLHRRGPEARGPDVTLTALFAGSMREWRGHIVRVEGEIDESTRMVHAVVRVRDPYDRDGQRNGVPLAAGMFVNAAIDGHVLEDVIAVPRDGIRSGDRVLVIEPDADAEGVERPGGERAGRLRQRDVHVVRREPDRVLVDEGLRDGEIVCTSPLEIATEGMRVAYVLGAPDASAPGSDSGARKR